MLIVVTGASRGIGLELVKHFCQNSQDLVMGIARHTESLAELQKRLPNLIAVESDIATTAGRSHVIAEILKTKRTVHILINNAGHMVNRPFAEITEGELNAVYQANVFAPFLLTQALLPSMSRGTRVINIGSMGGVNGTAKFPGLTAYSSSKGALSILSECMAEELRPSGISVNCLALGSVQTEMLAQAFPGYKAGTTAEEMAGHIARFALTEAPFYNGKTLPVSNSTP